MLVRLFSDIHWEHDLKRFHQTKVYNPDAVEVFPYWIPEELPTDSVTTLILAGDLWNGLHSIGIIAEFNKRFKHVLVVLGNHDAWRTSYNDLPFDYEVELFAKSLNNVTLLNRSSIEIEGVLFIGATLWSDMNKGSPVVINISKQIMGADFGLINMGKSIDEDYIAHVRPFKPEHWLYYNRMDFDYIKHVTRHNKDKQVVIITHHGITMNSVHPRFQNAGDSNYFFCSDYSEFILDNPNISHCFHGHIHNNMDYMVGPTRVITNPRGYPGENQEFSSESLYEI